MDSTRPGSAQKARLEVFERAEASSREGTTADAHSTFGTSIIEICHWYC